jgi:hypothetical protein
MKVEHGLKARAIRLVQVVRAALRLAVLAAQGDQQQPQLDVDPMVVGLRLNSRRMPRCR